MLPNITPLLKVMPLISQGAVHGGDETVYSTYVMDKQTDEWTFLGWELLKFCSLLSPLGKFLILQKYKLDSLNHIHV